MNNQFVFSGQFVPGQGESGYAGFSPKNVWELNPWNQPAGQDNNFDGGDPGLNYRFWDQSKDSGYKGSEIEDAEVDAEEQAFLGLENLFACRRQCKADQGGYPSLRQCIRACKGKGPTRSFLKGKEADTNAQMAAALTAMASDKGNDSASRESSGGSSKTIWIIVGIVAVIGIAVGIYFMTRNKAVPVVA